MIEAIAEADDEAMRAYLEEQRAVAGAPARGAAPGDGRRARGAGAVRRGLPATRACSRCSTRWSTSCRRRTTSRRWWARTWPGSATERRADRRRAVLGAGVQDHERPVRRLADLLPGLLGQGRRRARRSTTPARGSASGSGASCSMHANKREDVKEVTCGNIAAAAGLRVTATGDTLCDEKTPVVLEVMEFPAPVISIAIEPKTQANQDKIGLALAKLAIEDPSFSVQDRRRDRADDHLGDGRAAPGDHRRQAGARVQDRGLRRAAAGRLPRDDRARGRRRGEVHPADRRARRSTATSRCTSSRPRAKGSSSRTRPSAASSRASSCRRSSAACASRWRAA